MAQRSRGAPLGSWLYEGTPKEETQNKKRKTKNPTNHRKKQWEIHGTAKRGESGLGVLGQDAPAVPSAQI